MNESALSSVQILGVCDLQCVILTENANRLLLEWQDWKHGKGLCRCFTCTAFYRDTGESYSLCLDLEAIQGLMVAGVIEKTTTSYETAGT